MRFPLRFKKTAKTAKLINKFLIKYIKQTIDTINRLSVYLRSTFCVIYWAQRRGMSITPNTARLCAELAQISKPYVSPEK